MLRFGVPFLVFLALALTGSAANAQKAASDVDPDPRLAFRFDQQMKFGLTVLKDAAGQPVNKLLTYDPLGRTNDYLVKLNGENLEFGSADGKWLQRNAKLPNGSKSVWVIDKVEISQILEIVSAGQPVQVAPNVRKRILDTCMVRYEIVNKDTKKHDVGMRIMIDTLIGGNDGVPFAVPTLPALVTTFKDFPKPNDVPYFIQALEFPNLQSPGTVGLMTLKLGGDIDVPDRVSLTHWIPAPPWNVPLKNMMNDSCVVMYWNARAVKPNEKRVIGFAYGVGRVSADEGTGRLALTTNGSFLPGSEFTVTAYVQKPAKNETLTIEGSKGVALVKGKDTETVPALAAGAKENTTSTVTWTLKAADRGTYHIRVRSSEGVTQTQVVTIRGE